MDAGAAAPGAAKQRCGVSASAARSARTHFCINAWRSAFPSVWSSSWNTNVIDVSSVVAVASTSTQAAFAIASLAYEIELY
jgi:hypothetical protein